MKQTAPMRTIISAAILALALTACGDSSNERAGEVETEATQPPEEIIETDTEVAEPTEDVPLETEFAVGDTVELGDWSVKVTNVKLNANKILLDPDFYNEQPDGQYLLATYEATYNGSERTADVIIDLTWSYTTTDQVVHEIDYQTTPGDSAPDETRTGGTLTKDVEFDLDPALIKGGVLSVSTYQDGEEVYADFPIE